MTNTVSDKRPPWDKRLLIFALTEPNIEKTLYKVPSVPNTLVLPVDIVDVGYQDGDLGTVHP